MHKLLVILESIRGRRQQRSPLDEAFQRERAAGLRLALMVRIVALSALAIWLVTRAGIDRGDYYAERLGVFVALGVAQWVAGRRDGTPSRALLALFVLLDMAYLAWLSTAPPASPGETWPAAMQLRLGSFTFFFVFIAFAGLSYSPILALWTGFAAIAAWLGGVLFILAQPGSFTILDFTYLHRLDLEALRRLLLDPDYVSAIIVIQEALIAGIVAGILALAAARARRLALREAKSAGERANLARYFSPNLVDDLARDRAALSEVRAQEVAVLFVDIIGFTRLAEAMQPEAVIAILREFHARVAAAVFAHGGTLNKYMGDAVMATFGTPRHQPDDAARAIACCVAILQTLEEWNAARVAAGEPSIRAGLGAHFGPVVLGDIGDARCVEFAVLGDTVNIASRLEHGTRELGVAAILSEALILAAAATVSELPTQGLEPAPPLAVRNRVEPVPIRVLRRPPQGKPAASAEAGTPSRREPDARVMSQRAASPPTARALRGGPSPALDPGHPSAG